jgi:hypothetical protein
VEGAWRSLPWRLDYYPRGGRILVVEDAFTSGEGRNLERRGTHLVEEALPIAWRLTPFVVAYSSAIERAIVSEGA